MTAVIPLDSLARRIPIVAKLKSGATGRGGRPTALDKWRATTSSRPWAENFAARYGGEVKPFTANNSPHAWEVFSESTEVAIALIEDGYTISYEQWSAGGCQRRCNGITASVLQTTGPDNVEYVEGPCICDRKGVLECSLKSRLTFVLPDLPFAGGVVYETSSKNFAEESQGMLQLIQQMQARGVTRGVLRLEQRKSSGNRRYTIAVVGVTSSLEEIAAGGGARALGPAPERRPELSPPTVTGGDGESVASSLPSPDTMPPLADSPTNLPSASRTGPESTSGQQDLLRGDSGGQADKPPHKTSGVGEGEAPAPEQRGPDAEGREGDVGAVQPSLGGEDIVDAEVVEDEPPAFVLDKGERAKMRAAFFARTKGLGLDYDTQVKPWIQQRYKLPEGEGWSALSDEQASSLYDALIVPDGTRAQKDAAGEKFKSAVLDTVEVSA